MGNKSRKSQSKSSSRYFKRDNTKYYVQLCTQRGQNCQPSGTGMDERKYQKIVAQKNKVFKKYKKNGYKNEDKEILDRLRNECQEAIVNAKENYLWSKILLENLK